jgi:glycosyltransferase involved in cell wall biosynthesis
MLIGIDNYVNLNARQDKDGIFWVTHNLLSQIIRKAPKNYHLLFLQGWPNTLKKNGNHGGEEFEIPSVSIPGLGYDIWLRATLPVYLATARKKSSLLWCPYGTSPSWSPCPVVSILHDLAYLRYPHYFTRRSVRFFERHTASLVANSACIVVPSEHTRNEIVQNFSVDPNKLRVIHWGVEESFYPRPEVEIEACLAKYCLGRPYVLFVGTRQPRKNLARLIEAFISLKKHTQLPHKLVLAGRWGWMNEPLIRLLGERDVQEHVLLLDYVPRADLPYLYSGAELFILPSLHEGFGLPVVEAMACGTPVAAANNSSLTEILGDAGMLFEADDVTQIQCAIQTILDSSAVRSRLRDKGLARAKDFSWNQSGDQLLKVFSEFS